MDNIDKKAELHSVGATVNHKSPYSEWSSLKNDRKLTQDFIDEWVVPYYTTIASYDDDSWIEKLKVVKEQVSREVVLTLLGDFNWRSRLVGAYFAAMKGYADLIDVIGIHLIKSEVCCVGHIYALVLAFFNTPKSVHYLELYLSYYLSKPALYFDQQSIMEALKYLDAINGTNQIEGYQNKWFLLIDERVHIEKRNSVELAKMLDELKGAGSGEKYLMKTDLEFKANGIQKISERKELGIEYYEEQIPILVELAAHL